VEIVCCHQRLKRSRDLQNKIRPQNNIHAFSSLGCFFLADALVGSRGNRERGVQERVLSALLTEMDGIGIQQDSVSTMYKTYRGNKSVCPPQVVGCNELLMDFLYKWIDTALFCCCSSCKRKM
jgi:hypothetical protein